MSRHHRHIPTAVSLTLALAAAAPSTASPRPFGPIAPAVTTQPQAPHAVNPQARHAANINVGGIQAQEARVAHKLAARDAAIGSATQSPPLPLIVRFSQPNGFAWDDAGIGAGATFALILILLGSAISLTHRHTARMTRAGIRPASTITRWTRRARSEMQDCHPDQRQLAVPSRRSSSGATAAGRATALMSAEASLAGAAPARTGHADAPSGRAWRSCARRPDQLPQRQSQLPAVPRHRPITRACKEPKHHRQPQLHPRAPAPQRRRDHALHLPVTRTWGARSLERDVNEAHAAHLYEGADRDE